MHIHVLDELKKMVGQCKVQKIQPPPGAKEAIGDLEKTVVGQANLACTFSLAVSCHLPSRHLVFWALFDPE